MQTRSPSPRQLGRRFLSLPLIAPIYPLIRMQSASQRERETEALFAIEKIDFGKVGRKEGRKEGYIVRPHKLSTN